ncbi:hypothetical protein, partial [Amycolatopsis marina]|uniref:hypothetical protein n=1 Tax=Amycolatopsis marina TaxID=490629 RepID=UPI001C430695
MAGGCGDGEGVVGGVDGVVPAGLVLQTVVSFAEADEAFFGGGAVLVPVEAVVEFTGLRGPVTPRCAALSIPDADELVEGGGGSVAGAA